jgi:succinate dehydrogenase / fumarate reductase cytochrome b subunit
MSMLGLYRSAVGKKALMAGSGVLLFGFVLVHMIGNLKLYMGPEKIDYYAAWLREVGYPFLPHGGALWIFRVVLLAAVVIHLVSAYQVTMMSRRARPIGYKARETVRADYASRTMTWGGVILALFVIYHLLHLTWGTVHPEFKGHTVGPGGELVFYAYHNVVAGFRVWWVSAFYIVANLCLGMHLYHGLWSMFQSLGLERQSEQPWRRQFAVVFAIVVTLGNLSFPIAVLTGLVE